MTILLTGVAGFIGYHVARRLAERGEQLIGVDNMNEFYGRELKRRRLVQLATFPGFKFKQVELTKRGEIEEAVRGERVRSIVHLAAQANVRYALENPYAYLDSNVVAHLNILEHCRNVGMPENIVYASSSSVYGRGNEVPFREDSDTDHPTSLYAATKKSQELMSECYANLFSLPMVGLRFFSVYGPWGRPDMAYWLFTEAILKSKPIRLFNNGDMERDFTYVDDVVTGVVAAIDSKAGQGDSLHRIYNLGAGRPVHLMHMIEILEELLGRRAELEMLPMQPGELAVTCADISRAEAELGYSPRIALEDGLRRFVDWYRRYLGMAK
jgi:UDP-glucuronate 4-epimerase